MLISAGRRHRQELWEFALGGLLALHADRVVLTLRERIAAGWFGVRGLVACGMALPVASVFPGFAAELQGGQHLR